MAAVNNVMNVFQKYQKARVDFVQSVAELSTRPQNVDLMQNAGVMALLRPLLLDNVPSIQQTAALALGRMANYSEQIAQSVVRNNILPDLVKSLGQSNTYQQKASAFVLRAVARHSPDLAQFVVDAQALPPLRKCLESIDPTVKEAAVWSFDYIAQHNVELAKSVVQEGVIPLLVLCLDEPELPLKRIAACALGDIAKHDENLAGKIVETNALDSFKLLLDGSDGKLKRQICACLAQIVKHSDFLANKVVEEDLLPGIMNCLRSRDELVQKNACVFVRELAKRSARMSEILVQNGAVDELLDYNHNAIGDLCLPGAMAVGWIGGFSPESAMAFCDGGGVNVLKRILIEENADDVRAATAWALGQLGKHSAHHAAVMGEEDVYRELIACFTSQNASDDLKKKSRKALKFILGQCADLEALRPLLGDAPPKVQKYVLRQFADTLPNDPSARRVFVESGALKYIQELNQQEDGKLSDIIEQVKAVFPQDVVDYYSPDFANRLIDTHFGHLDDEEEEES